MKSHKLCPFVWLLSFTLMFSRFAHVVVCIRIAFLFKGGTIFYCMCIYPFCSLFIHRYTHGCFHLLATVNNAVMNISVKIFLWDPTLNSFGYIPKMGLLDHKAIIFLVFWGLSILFSLVAVPFYISANSA